MQKYWLFSSNNNYLWTDESAKKPEKKKGKESEETFG